MFSSSGLVDRKVRSTITPESTGLSRSSMEASRSGYTMR